MASLDFSELLTEAANVYSQNQHLLSMYLLLVLSALFPIYTGSFASLSRPSSAGKPPKRDKDVDEEDDEEEMVQKLEGLSPSDAIIFPVTAFVVLAILYWVITTWGAGLTNTILGIYFAFIGTYSVGKLISDTWSTVADFFMPNYFVRNGTVWQVSGDQRTAVVVGGGGDEASSRTTPFGGKASSVTEALPAWLLNYAWAIRDLSRRKYVLRGYMQDMLDLRLVLTRHNVVASVLGVVAVGYFLFVDKPWWLTNLQGFAVCYGALQLMSPTTFATGTLILSGLFFYDIWAVFFTPFMVTVAQNLDVPIKLVFPRPEDPNFPREEDAKPSYSMLGLGDIVLPGLMIALALRFDLYMFYLRKQRTITQPSGKDITTSTVEKAPYVSVSGDWAHQCLISLRSNTQPTGSPPRLSGAFPKTYFHASLVGYVFGMVATLVCMTLFKHAQPALLYLVPCVLTSIWGTAMVRGEIGAMWAFTEAEESDSNVTEQAKPEAVDEHVIARPAWVTENAVISFIITPQSPRSKR